MGLHPITQGGEHMLKKPRQILGKTDGLSNKRQICFIPKYVYEVNFQNFNNFADIDTVLLSQLDIYTHSFKGTKIVLQN